MCETRRMDELRTQLKVIQGGAPDLKAQFAYLCEEVDAKLALPQMRLLARRIRPAANSSLQVLEPGSAATISCAQGSQDTHEQT